MDISIIIVSWNVKNKLKDNLAALFRSEGGFSYEILVVDNDSKDGTAKMIAHDFPQVKLIANRENLGFAKANNQGIREATGSYVLLLNPDMLVFPETLRNILKWADNHPLAAVAGCRLIDERGSLIKHVRRFPTIWDQLAIVFKIPHLFPRILNKYIKEDFDYEKSQAVDSIRGGFFLMRRNTLEKIGSLDERFFVWFEEVDYCRRVYQGGLQVWYTPYAECIDYVGQSFKQVDRSTAQYYFRDSMLKYFHKWHPFWQYYCLKTAWIFGILLTKIAKLLSIDSNVKT